MTGSATAWAKANQRYLLAELARVREALERRTDGPGGTRAGRRGARRAGSTTAAPTPWKGAGTPALARLVEAFGLSPFERDLVLLCAGPELDTAFATVVKSCGAPRPTFSLALATLAEPHWSALTPDAPLRYWRLVTVGAADTLATGPLRLDERVLHFLAGAHGIDERLHGIAEPVPASAVLPASHGRGAARLVSLWTASSATDGGLLPFLCGDDPAGRRAVIDAASRRFGLTAYRARSGDLPSQAAERESLARLWERESLLGAVALLVEVDEVDPPEVARAAVAFAERLRAPVAVAAREPLATVVRSAVRVTVDRPTSDEQRALWRAALGDEAATLDGKLDELVSQFGLGVPEIVRAVASALSGGVEDAGAPAAGARAAGAADATDAGLAGRLWDACRANARPRLDELAQRIEANAKWEHLVLPEPQSRTLHEIVAQVRHRTRVYETWGFAEQSARGLGLSAMSAGPSGTGKTLAAEVIAASLSLDLYRIDLSQVVNKYIGETEKNLRRVFDAAEESGAVLLFDEADALFGKRSQVKDAHDRYANIEVSYLLQRMESYRGLAVLTTNLKEALDEAFLRRLRFVVTFPFPDAAQRAEIWRRVFPGDTPTAGLEPAKLGRLAVTGGNIRNIALGAAFLAAAERGPDRAVRMEHVLRAARAELNKMDRPLSAAEVAGWV